MNRRQFLGLTGAFLPTLSGCAGNKSASSPTDTPRGTGSPSSSPSESRRPTESPRDPKPLSIAGAWPQQGFDPGHGGVTALPGVPVDGEPYWQLHHKQSGPPVSADGHLFHYALALADRSTDLDKYLVCRDARNGRIQWARPITHGSRWPVVVEGHVVTAGTGVIAAFHTTDGTERWRHDIGTRRARVSTAVDGTVLVSTELPRDSNRAADVRAYRVANGTRRWKRASPKWQAEVAATGDTVLSLSAAFQVGTVLTARALADGSERWSIEIDDNGIPNGPFVGGETVYVAPDDEGVFAFDLATGDRHWHYAAEAGNIVRVAASETTAYLLDADRLVAYAAADGTERWSVSTGTNHTSRAAPAVGRDTIYFGTGGLPADFVALSREDRRERWRYQLPKATIGDVVTSGLEAQPAIVDGAVYVEAVNGLYAFGPKG